ncbi:MAG: hypothetical protein E7664_06500 [Ruminococcaceae bacterium]|nr:hypothetical protein [Oscillospiraceae bacterium]
MDRHVDGDDSDHLCEYGCGQIADDGCYDADTDSDHTCDECGAENITEHRDGDDSDHLCEYGCGQVADDGCYGADTDTDHTCDECGAENVTEHEWLDATVDAPKTCKVCALTEGKPLPKESTSFSENTDSDDGTKGKSLSGGAIAGIVIASVALLGGGGTAVYLLVIKKKQ